MVILMPGKKTSSNIKKNDEESSLKSPTIFISITNEKIQQKVNEISTKNLSWNDLNWLIGEQEVKLSKAIEDPPNLWTIPLPPKIKINLSKIIQKPSIDEIRNHAISLSHQHLSIPQQQWNLALREYIFDSMKEIK